MREFGGFLSFSGVKKVCNLFIAAPDDLGFVLIFFQFFSWFFSPTLQARAFVESFSFV
jgi:hypothetical protein